MLSSSQFRYRPKMEKIGPPSCSCLARKRICELSFVQKLRIEGRRNVTDERFLLTFSSIALGPICPAVAKETFKRMLNTALREKSPTTPFGHTCNSQLRVARDATPSKHAECDGVDPQNLRRPRARVRLCRQKPFSTAWVLPARPC